MQCESDLIPDLNGWEDRNMKPFPMKNCQGNEEELKTSNKGISVQFVHHLVRFRVIPYFQCIQWEKQNMTILGGRLV